jgi:hypothetical protein
MKIFSFFAIMVCCFSLFITNGNDKAYFEVSIQFCNETYKEFFGNDFTSGIIKLVDENGNKYSMEVDPKKSSRFYIHELPFGNYKITYKNIKGEKMSALVVVNQSSQTYDLCIDNGVEWVLPTIFNSIQDNEFLEILFEGVGGVYYYEKILIGRRGEEYFIKSVLLKRDYTKNDTTKSYYENLVFNEIPTKNTFTSISAYDIEWLGLIETLIRFLETKTTCAANEERYYFIKNGELLGEFRNGFCYPISPWGKVAKKFFNK